MILCGHTSFSLTNNVQCHLSTVNALVFETFQVQVVVFCAQFGNREIASVLIRRLLLRLLECVQPVISVSPKDFLIWKKTSLYNWQIFDRKLRIIWSINDTVKGYFIFITRTIVSQNVKTWFSVQLAFAKFLSKIKGNFWVSAPSMILALC